MPCLDSFLAIIVGIKRPFHLTDITMKSLIWMEVLIHQKNYLQREILWNTIIKYYIVTWLIFMNQVASFGINEHLQNFHKYMPTKHLNVYSILVQRVMNFTTNWVSDITSIKLLESSVTPLVVINLFHVSWFAQTIFIMVSLTC